MINAYRPLVFLVAYRILVKPSLAYSNLLKFTRNTVVYPVGTGDYATCGSCHFAHAARSVHAPRLLQRYDQWVSRTNKASLLVYYIQARRSLSSRRNNFKLCLLIKSTALSYYLPCKHSCQNSRWKLTRAVRSLSCSHRTARGKRM